MKPIKCTLYIERWIKFGIGRTSMLYSAPFDSITEAENFIKSAKRDDKEHNIKFYEIVPREEKK